MTLEPVLNTSPVIQFHLALISLVILLTIIIFSLPKGSRLHRRLGWAWVVIMGGVALSSFGIHTIEWIGPFSPIHLLSVLVLCSLYFAVQAARTHQVTAHQRTMKSLVFYGLIVTGAFTLLPGRIMHQIFLGG